MKSKSVVGNTVTLRTVVPRTDKVPDVVVDVLRTSTSDDAAKRIEQRRMLGVGGNVVLFVGAYGVGTLINVSLAPRFDYGGTAGKYGRAILDANSNRNVGKPGVIDDNRAGEGCRRRERCLDENRGILHDCVDKSMSCCAFIVELHADLKMAEW